MTRVAIAIAAALVVAGTAFFFLTSDSSVPDDAPTLDGMADAIGTTLMTNINRGHIPDRSGEIMLVPKPHRFLLGAWDLRSLGTARPEPQTSHPNPWNYLAHVPIIGYGPGYFPVQENDDLVDISYIAPTFADFLGTSLDTDSPSLPGATTGRRPPKAIVTVVIDGGGWNALRQHPYSWPAIAQLAGEGSNYTRAHIGSAPSITGALHATFGTGVYPIDHGLPGNQMRGPDGKNIDAWKQNADPSYLRVPTLADVYDLEQGNRSQVVSVAFEDWHLGMIGHGGQFEGGDKDVAVIWDTDASEWWINEEFYEFPSYIDEHDSSQLDEMEAELDPRDGVTDEKWFGHPIADIATGQLGPYHFRYASPAFVRLTGDVTLDVLEHEKVGVDAVPDLAWIELKTPDYAGHAFNVVSSEQADVLRETDAQIARIKEYLDQTAGRGNYVLLVSADHGQEPLPDAFGGWRINSDEMLLDIEREFGPIVEKITPVDIYFDMDAVEGEGVSLTDVARYIAVYTIGENIPEGAPGADRVPEGRLDELLFAGAFPTDYLSGLSTEKLESFDDSDYPEGEFVFEDPLGEEAP